MRRASDEPLRKVTLDLYAKDMDELRRVHGYGVAGVVRKLIRAHLRAIKPETSDDLPCE